MPDCQCPHYYTRATILAGSGALEPSRAAIPWSGGHPNYLRVVLSWFGIPQARSRDYDQATSQLSCLFRLRYLGLLRSRVSGVPPYPWWSLRPVGTLGLALGAMQAAWRYSRQAIWVARPGPIGPWAASRLALARLFRKFFPKVAVWSRKLKSRTKVAVSL